MERCERLEIRLTPVEKGWLTAVAKAHDLTLTALLLAAVADLQVKESA